MDKEKAKEWLEEHWTESKKCPVCGGDGFLTLDKIWNLISIDGQRMVPAIIAVCVTCSYMRFFSAIGMGLVDKDTGKVL